MDYSTCLRTICEIAQCSILLPLVLALGRFQKLDLVFKLLLLLLIVSTFVGFIGYQLYTKVENNIPLLHLYTLAEGYLWALIYYRLLVVPRHKQILLGLVAFFSLFMIINSGSWQLIFKINYYNRLVSSLLLLYCSVTWFLVTLRTQDLWHARYDGVFWLNAGVLLYGLNNAVFALVLLWMNNSPKAALLEVWTLYSVFVMMHYFLITIGIWRQNKVLMDG